MPALVMLLLFFSVLLPAAPPTKSDSAIEQSIRAKFAKSKVAEDKFTVRVQGGVAVIEGTTKVIQRKGVATRLAKSGGAVRVDNRIRIDEAAKQKAAEKLAEHRPRAASRPAAPKPDSAPQAEPQPKPIPRAVVKH